MSAVELVPPIDRALEPRDLLGGVVVEGGRPHLRHGLQVGHEDEGLEDGPAREEHGALGPASTRTDAAPWGCSARGTALPCPRCPWSGAVPPAVLTWRGQGWL